MKADNTKSLNDNMAAGMNTMKEGLDMWGEYAQAYTDFVVQITRNNMAAMVEAREQWDKVMSDTVSKTTKMAAHEQEMAMGMMGAFQTQAKGMMEQMTKFWDSSMNQNKDLINRMSGVVEQAASQTRDMADQMAGMMDGTKKAK